MPRCVRCENYLPEEQLFKLTFFVMERELSDDETKRLISPTFNYIICQRCKNLSYLYDDTYDHSNYWYRCIKILFALDRIYDEAPKMKVQRGKNARKDL